MSDGELLKPSEVCARLKVSRAWLYRAAADERIPSLRLGGPGGPLRFDAAELWGPSADRRSAVYADLWEVYLEPA